MQNLNPAIPITHGTLLGTLDDYRRPNDKIARMMQSGELLQIKRGLYLDGDSGELASRGLIANHLLGPSYVSMDAALEHYGLIPEAAQTTTSITTKRSKVFETAFGRYEFIHADPAWFQIGLDMAQLSDNTHFVIASAEKALCDKIVFTRNVNIQSRRRMQDYLLADLRLDEMLLSKFDLNIIESCIGTGRKASALSALLSVLRRIR